MSVWATGTLVKTRSHDVWFLPHDFVLEVASITLRADPGETLRTGQIDEDGVAPTEESLGPLALGAAGLLAWRKR